MDKDQLLSLYGQPSNIDTRRSTWKYSNLGFDIHFGLNIVTGITIYSNGNKKFDWSGLTANDSKYDFERKYKSKFSSRNLMRIGHGEMIAIGNNYVGLSIINPYNAGFSYAE